MSLQTLDVVSKADFDGHEKVVRVTDAASGLHAIIALHNTNLGPGLGGCRMYPYVNEEAACTDALRLSRGSLTSQWEASLSRVPEWTGKGLALSEVSRLLPAFVWSPDSLTVWERLGRQFHDPLWPASRMQSCASSSHRDTRAHVGSLRSGRVCHLAG